MASTKTRAEAVPEVLACTLEIHKSGRSTRSRRLAIKTLFVDLVCPVADSSLPILPARKIIALATNSLWILIGERDGRHNLHPGYAASLSMRVVSGFATLLGDRGT